MRILFVEDNRTTYEDAIKQLGSLNHEVVVTSTIDGGLRALKYELFDAVFLDWRFEEGNEKTSAGLVRLALKLGYLPYIVTYDEKEELHQSLKDLYEKITFLLKMFWQVPLAQNG